MAKLLLIEDYPSLLKIYTEVLELEDHTVDQATTAEAGLKMAQTTTYDLILLDLLLPKTGGIDFLRTFDALHHPETKVIIISNIYSPEILNQALELGASHYVLKADITPQQLAKTVQDTLAQRKQEDK